MLRAFRDKDGWRRWLLPLALAASNSAAAIYVWNYSQLRSWLFPIIAGFGIAALAAMAVWLFRPKKVLLSIAAGSMILSMLAGPFYWPLTAALSTSVKTSPCLMPVLSWRPNRSNVKPNKNFGPRFLLKQRKRGLAFNGKQAGSVFFPRLPVLPAESG